MFKIKYFKKKSQSIYILYIITIHWLNLYSIFFSDIKFMCGKFCCKIHVHYIFFENVIIKTAVVNYLVINPSLLFLLLLSIIYFTPSFPTIQSPTQKNNEKTPNRDRTNNVINSCKAWILLRIVQFMLQRKIYLCLLFYFIYYSISWYF